MGSSSLKWHILDLVARFHPQPLGTVNVCTERTQENLGVIHVNTADDA